jgi:PAS domain S-box-containing protein
MKNKSITKSTNSKMNKTVKKQILPFKKSSSLNKSKNTGTHKPLLKNTAALIKKTAILQGIQDLEKYRNIMENIHDGCFEVNLEGNFTFFNNSVCRVFGYSREELMGMNYRHYTDEKTTEKVFQAYNKVYKTGQPLEDFVWQIKRKDGVTRYIEGSVSLQKDASGKPIGFLGIANDITKRIHMEEILHDEEQRFRALAEQSSDIIILIDKKGLITYENPAVERILGLKNEERIGKNVLENLHPDDLHIVTNAFNILIGDKNAPLQQGEIRIRHINGEWHHFETVASNLLQENGVEEIIINLRDITNRKKSDEERSRLMAILESTSDLVATAKPDGQVTYINIAGRRMLGWNEDEDICTHRVSEAHQSQVKQLLENEGFPSASKQGVWRSDTAIITKDGLEIPVSQVIMAHYSPNGEVEYFSTIMRDIRERKQAEESIKKAASEWQATFDAVSDAICLLDMDQRITRCNRAMNEMFDVTHNKLIGSHCCEILHGTLEPIAECPVTKIKSSMQREETELLRNRRWLSVIAYPLLNDSGTLIGFVHIMRDISDRKRAEKHLRESEERYRTFFDTSRDCVFITSLDGHWLNMNDSACDFFGYPSRDELMQTRISDLYWKAEEYKNHVNKIIEKGYSKDYAVDLLRKDGHLIHTLITSSVRYDANGNIIGIMGTIKDITERKKAEEKIKAEEQRLRGITENLPGVIYQFYVKDSGEYGVSYISEPFNEFAEIMSKSDVENLDSVFLEFYSRLHEDDKERLLTSTKESAETLSRWNFEGRVATKSGKMLWIQGLSIPTRLEDKVVFDGIILNINERKIMEQSLRDSEEKFRILTESSPTAVMLYQNNKWVYANPVSAEITGYTNQELQRMNFWDIVHPDDKQLVQERGLKRQKGEAVTQRYIFRIICKDGTVKWVDLSGATIVIGGSPAGIISVLDITERKLVEEEIRLLNESLEQRVRERTTELEAFSYSVSHDLRAPLRAIDGFSQALLEDYESKFDAQGKDYLMRIRNSTRLMAELIEDLLKLSRVTRSDMDILPVNLTKMARSIMDELQKSQPQRLANIKIDDSLDDSADPRLIRIVLENLLGNAWKFTEKKSITEIEFKSIKKDGKRVYLIHDNGAGFDMDYVERLFAPFQRLHNIEDYSGTGIGLATVKRIISRHGGTIWAEGETGQGATFYFTLHE